MRTRRGTIYPVSAMADTDLRIIFASETRVQIYRSGDACESGQIMPDERGNICARARDAAAQYYARCALQYASNGGYIVTRVRFSFVVGKFGGMFICTNVIHWVFFFHCEMTSCNMHIE